MSAPDTKALSPAPVTTTTRIAGSFSNSSRMTGIASHMSVEVALCFCGLLKTSLPTGPAFSAIMLGVGLKFISDHSPLAEAGDRLVVVAGLLEDGVGMLALLGSRGFHLELGATHVDGLADQLDLAQLGVLDGVRHLQVLDLRISEHLVHLVDQ